VLPLSTNNKKGESGPKKKQTNAIQSPFKDVVFVKVIARGSQATVYQCQFKHQTFASKHVAKDDNVSKVNKDALKREIGILEELKHKNILKFVEKIFAEQEIILIIELCDWSLQEMMKFRTQHENSLKIDEMIWCAKEIAEGVKYLHSTPIVHKDLKTKNVLVKKDSRHFKFTDQQICICDFGNSEPSRDCHSYGGTPRFIAPEVIKVKENRGSFDGFKADVWSFGMLLYELMTGTLPYFGVDDITVIELYTLRGIKPYLNLFIDEHNLMKNPKWKEFILLHKSCTQMEPAARPTIESILDKLQQLLIQTH